MKKLTEPNELENLFHNLVVKAKEQDIIYGRALSIDSTKLNCYEATKLLMIGKILIGE